MFNILNKLCSFNLHYFDYVIPSRPCRDRNLNLDFGDYSPGDTPLPIPNREVKTWYADGTACAGVWESR